MYDKVIDLNFKKTCSTGFFPKFCPNMDIWNFRIIGYDTGPGVNLQKMPSSGDV
jgi:hypothetical protein